MKSLLQLSSIRHKLGQRGHTPLLLFALAVLYLSLGLTSVSEPIFDELHYMVESHRMFVNQGTLMHHPPLAKLFIWLGIYLFGNGPLGWRFFSVLFGAWIVVSTFKIGETLFKDKRAATLAALLCLSNGLFYVFSRIGMLDIYMVAFAIAGLEICLRHFNGAVRRRELILAGFLYGASFGSKWYGFFPWLFSAVAILWIGVILKERPFKQVLLDCGALTLPIPFIYLVGFVPFLIVREDFVSLTQVITMHWGWILSHVAFKKEHDYMSAPWDWPLIFRPMWLIFKANETHFKGVFAVGNPVLFVAGFFGLFPCAYAAFWKRNRTCLFLVLSWFLSLFAWVIIPRQIEFYYYYLFPSLFLPLVLVQGAVDPEKNFPEGLRKAFRYAIPLSFVCALWFIPVWTAVELPLSTFELWAWFDSWI